MLSRRELLVSGAFASRLSPAEDAPQRSAQGGDIDVAGLTSALRDLRHLTPLPEMATIQDRQRLHFKVAQHFPNYIDIGLTVWEHLTQWHLENRLPLKAVRTPDGRMEMEFLFTTLVLKPDVAETWIGNPYD